MKIKPGVILPPIVKALLVVNDILEDHQFEFVITSMLDGKHKPGSLHYEGAAFDFRSRHMTMYMKQLIATEIRDKLGPDFDVIVEYTHFHVEVDAK